MKKHILVLIFTFSSLWLSGCTSTIDIDTSSTTAYGPKVFESPSFTAITVAYAPEMQGILNRIEQDPNASIHTTTNIKGITYRLGTYHDQPILVFATGMSIAMRRYLCKWR